MDESKRRERKAGGYQRDWKQRVNTTRIIKIGWKEEENSVGYYGVP